MIYQTLENTPIDINLVAQSVTTGWSFSGSRAIHEVCNAGSIYLNPPPGIEIIAGQTYRITYNIISITGSVGSLYIQPFMGTTAGVQRIAPGFIQETLTAAGSNPRFRFYSNTDCEIEIFNIQNTAEVTTAKQQNNIVYSEKLNKWPSFYTYNPDYGFGLFINLYTIKNGDLYVHEHGSTDRNDFYGTQYNTIVNLPFNQHIANSNTFQSVSVQGNELMVTTTDGVISSLGQVSDLIAQDFTKSTMVDGSTVVTINSVEGIYSAPFMRDKNSIGGIIDGDVLKGNYLLIELVTTTANQLKLLNVAVHSEHSYIGAR